MSLRITTILPLTLLICTCLAAGVYSWGAPWSDGWEDSLDPQQNTKGDTSSSIRMIGDPLNPEPPLVQSTNRTIVGRVLGFTAIPSTIKLEVLNSVRTPFPLQQFLNNKLIDHMSYIGEFEVELDEKGIFQAFKNGDIVEATICSQTSHDGSVMPILYKRVFLTRLTNTAKEDTFPHLLVDHSYYMENGVPADTSFYCQNYKFTQDMIFSDGTAVFTNELPDQNGDSKPAISIRRLDHVTVESLAAQLKAIDYSKTELTADLPKSTTPSTLPLYFRTWTATNKSENDRYHQIHKILYINPDGCQLESARVYPASTQTSKVIQTLADIRKQAISKKAAGQNPGDFIMDESEGKMPITPTFYSKDYGVASDF